jgi:hypothetical protein
LDVEFFHDEAWCAHNRRWRARIGQALLAIFPAADKVRHLLYRGRPGALLGGECAAYTPIMATLGLQDESCVCRHRNRRRSLLVLARHLYSDELTRCQVAHTLSKMTAMGPPEFS